MPLWEGRGGQHMVLTGVQNEGIKLRTMFSLFMREECYIDGQVGARFPSEIVIH